MNNKNSREIKFRIWDKKRFFFDDELMITQDGEICCSPMGESLFFVPKENYVIQQFTGLLDKNGREIYEGDIVDYRHDGMSEFEKERMKDLLVSPVYWDYERWRINYSAASYAWHIMEVVGNIFENPELCSTN